jgi:uncharacterized protein (TIGR02231 family)
MRFSLSLLALAAALPGWADTYSVDSKVTEVTMHPGVATATRRATTEVTTGRHRLEIRGIPRDTSVESLRIDLSGARLIGSVYREDYLPPDDFTTDAVRAAEDRVKRLEQEIQVIRDEADRARTGARAAEISISFLQGLGKNEGLAGTGPDALRQIAQMVAEEAGRATDQALSAEITARRIETQLEDLEKELKEARAALRAISVEDVERLYLALEIQADEPGPVDVAVTYLSESYSGWQTAYEFHLTSGPEPRLTIDRDALLMQNTGESWTDVSLHLTTADPGQALAPSILHPWPLRIFEPRPRQQSSFDVSAGQSARLAEPIVEAPVILEEAAPAWVQSKGEEVTYSFAEPITLHSGADFMRLDLDQISPEIDLQAQAVPRYDTTAYRIIRFVNATGEELLASDMAAFFVDGDFIGQEGFAGLVPGDEAELGFGRIDGLRLTRDILNRNEGDEGLLTRSNRKDEQVEIKVENLTGQAWPVRLVDQVPFSEQEDLEISWTANPRPTGENPENKRGLLVWDLTLDAGKTQKIRLNSSVSWPEGMELR